MKRCALDTCKKVRCSLGNSEMCIPLFISKSFEIDRTETNDVFHLINRIFDNGNKSEISWAKERDLKNKSVNLSFIQF